MTPRTIRYQLVTPFPVCLPMPNGALSPFPVHLPFPTGTPICPSPYASHLRPELLLSPFLLCLPFDPRSPYASHMFNWNSFISLLPRQGTVIYLLSYCDAIALRHPVLNPFPLPLVPIVRMNLTLFFPTPHAPLSSEWVGPIPVFLLFPT